MVASQPQKAAAPTAYVLSPNSIRAPPPVPKANAVGGTHRLSSSPRLQDVAEINLNDLRQMDNEHQ